MGLCDTSYGWKIIFISSSGSLNFGSNKAESKLDRDIMIEVGHLEIYSMESSSWGIREEGEGAL